MQMNAAKDKQNDLVSSGGPNEQDKLCQRPSPIAFSICILPLSVTPPFLLYPSISCLLTSYMHKAAKQAYL